MLAVILRRGVGVAAHLAQRALDDARRKTAAARAIAAPGKLRQFDHLDGAGAVGQAADETALFQRGDQAMNSGLRAQIERILHLVERGRYAGLLQPLIDETQKFILFAREHLDQSPVRCRSYPRETSGAGPAPDVVVAGGWCCGVSRGRCLKASIL